MRHSVLTKLAAIALLSGCSSGMQVSQDWNPEVNFSGLETFGWLPETEARPQSQQLVAARITAAVEQTLTAKGLRLTESNPDLLIAWDAATEGKQSVSTYGSSYGGGYGRGRGRGRGGWGGGISYSTTSVNEWNEGTLIIDVFDGQSNELVYHGSAQAKLNESPSPEERTENVNQAVAKIFEKFPPGQ